MVKKKSVHTGLSCGRTQDLWQHGTWGLGLVAGTDRSSSSRESIELHRLYFTAYHKSFLFFLYDKSSLILSKHMLICALPGTMLNTQGRMKQDLHWLANPKKQLMWKIYHQMQKNVSSMNRSHAFKQWLATDTAYLYHSCASNLRCHTSWALT